MSKLSRVSRSVMIADPILISVLITLSGNGKYKLLAPVGINGLTKMISISSCSMRWCLEYSRAVPEILESAEPLELCSANVMLKLAVWNGEVSEIQLARYTALLIPPSGNSFTDEILIYSLSARKRNASSKHPMENVSNVSRGAAHTGECLLNEYPEKK